MKIVVAENHTLIREFIGDVARRNLGVEEVVEASTGLQAVSEILRVNPDMVVLAIDLPGFDGFTAIERVRELAPSPRVLATSAYCDRHIYERVRTARFHGYIDVANCGPEFLKHAMQEVLNHRSYFSASYKQLYHILATTQEDDIRHLSAREREILAWIGKLFTDHEIADRLNIASETVVKHRFNIQRKLGLKSRTELLRFARDYGFLRCVGPFEARGMICSAHGANRFEATRIIAES